MTAQDLMKSILQRAIQGKLVTQLNSETPAKENMRREGVAIRSDHVPFDLPDSWQWTTVGDVCSLINGRAFKPADWDEVGLPIVRIQNLNDPKASFNYYSGEVEEKHIITKGTLLFAWSGTPGTSFGAFIWDGSRAVLNQHIFKVHYRDVYDKRYLRVALNASLDRIIDKAHGAAGLRHITKKELEKIMIPVPPIEEQERIVAKIEELQPLVAKYGEAEQKLSALNAEFPDKLRKSILQQAVQGKLTKRDPADEPAAELLKRIRTEKDKLIADGKIKGEKKQLQIVGEEGPFDVPDTWEWTTLEALCCGTISYGIIKLGEEDLNGVKVLRCSDVKPGWIDESGIRTVKGDLSDEYSRTILSGGELVINVRGTLGGCAIIPKRFKGYNVAREVAVLPVSNSICKEYLLYLLLSPAFDDYLLNNLRGVAYKGLNIALLSAFPIPIPPLNEQKRIVANIEQLLPLCEKLK